MDILRSKFYMLATMHWRRSVVKYGCQGPSGQAIKLFQITPYVNDFQTFNNPGSWQPVGASKKTSFTFHFWQKS